MTSSIKAPLFAAGVYKLSVVTYFRLYRVVRAHMYGDVRNFTTNAHDAFYSRLK